MTTATRAARTVLALGMAGLLAACSASNPTKGLFGLKRDTKVAAATPASVEAAGGTGVKVGFCPKVQLITNEETFRTYAGGERSIDNVAYQASLYDVTRTCKQDGDRLLIEVSAAGRLLAGPKGAAGGTLAMPIRIAVKDSGGVPYSELETYSAAIEGGRTSDQFIYRRNTIAIPVTQDRRTIVLVGFDEGPPRS